MSDQTHSLVDLDDTDLVLADPREDVRGLLVLDRDGQDVGDVDGLLLDEAERRIRFLQVGSGGFLGLGRKTRLIPTNAITHLGAEAVRVDTTREQVAAGPEWDPDLQRQPSPDPYLTYYGYYNLPAFWAPGYVHPMWTLPAEEDLERGPRHREG